MSAENLSEYVGASSTDADFVAECWATATSLIARHVGIAEVPAGIIARATLEVGSELFHRRQAPNGIAQFATPDGGAAIRVARDPMVGARPLLAPFLPLGIA